MSEPTIMSKCKECGTLVKHLEGSIPYCTPCWTQMSHVEQERIIHLTKVHPLEITCPHCKETNAYSKTICDCCAKPIGRKFDEGKIQWTLFPWEAAEKIVIILMHGAKKYAPNNWKHVEPPMRYIDACYRHLNAWCSGEACDKDTGHSHLWHAGCNIVFAIWLEMKGKLVCPKE